MSEQEVSRDSPTTEKDKELADLLEDDELLEAERVALEGSVWRKLDTWILPLCTIIFILSFLDKTNIANARTAGMQKSLNLSNYQYTMVLTVTYVPYIAAEFPSSLLLKWIGPNVMLPAMVAMWGIVCTFQGVVHDYSGLLACRFFLGLMEGLVSSYSYWSLFIIAPGGLFPGLILYLSFFYPRRRLQMRVSAFFASASLAGAFSGLLAATIGEINGKTGRPGWAWIFILEGIFTFLFGLVSFFLLPASPERARFLSDKERTYVISRLKGDGAISQDDKSDGFKWREVVEAVKSPHVWIISPALFFSGTTLYSMAYFEPSIVAALGYAGNRAQLMTVPPFAVAFACSMISAFMSDRYRCRGLTTIVCAILSLMGFSMFYASESPHIRYGSLFFSVVGASSSALALSTWMANNSAPHTRRATSVAIAFIMANLGGIVSTWLLGTLSSPPRYAKAMITLIIMTIGIIVLSAINLAYLYRENRLKVERRRKMTREEESADLGDRSAWFIYAL